MKLSQNLLDEALNRFNGYWANDSQVCEDIAKKYKIDAKAFKNAVYKHLHEITKKFKKKEKPLSKQFVTVELMELVILLAEKRLEYEWNDLSGKMIIANPEDVSETIYNHEAQKMFDAFYSEYEEIVKQCIRNV